MAPERAPLLLGRYDRHRVGIEHELAGVIALVGAARGLRCLSRKLSGRFMRPLMGRSAQHSTLFQDST